MEERIGYLKQNKMREYANTIMRASQAFQRINFDVTQMAAEFIDLDEQCFEMSMKQAMDDEEVAIKMKENDEMVRTEVEKQKKVLSKDEARKILMEKIKLEFDSEKKLQNLKPKSKEEAQQMVMLERTKVMD